MEFDHEPQEKLKLPVEVPRHSADEPTLDELNTLQPGEYYMWDNHVFVKADKVTNTTITFECPFCYKQLNKDGQPRKGSKRRIHIHGSNADLTNRIEDRVSHCKEKSTRAGFRIGITDSTTRS